MLRNSRDSFDIVDFKQFVGGQEVSELCRKKQLQGNVYKYLKSIEVPFDFVEALADRFVLRNWMVGHDAYLFAQKAWELLNDVRKVVPPCVLHVFVLALFNGWPTNHRFQGKSSKCLLCNDCCGEDSLEHYAVCKFQWRMFAKRFSCSMFPLALERFFGLYARSIEMQTFHVVQLCAIYTATNHKRYQNERPEPESNIDKLLWHGHIRVCLFHKQLRKIYAHRFQTSMITSESLH